MYAELHAKSNFSFLEGASHPEELVDRAAELLSMKLVIGAEITPDDAPPLVLWPTDRAAYGRLARLITLGRRRAEKGECHLTLADVAGHAEGIIAGVCGGEGGGERGEGRVDGRRPAALHPSPFSLLPSAAHLA